MNKKGINFLGEETVKIIIATLCLVVLVGFFGRLYYNSQQNEDLEQAEATLNQLIREINDMQKNSETEREFDIWNPVKEKIPNPINDDWYFNQDFWVLIAFDKSSTMPNQCSNLDWDNCVCICKNLWYGNNYAEKCDKKDKGICIESKISLITYSRKEINLLDPPIKLNINKIDEGYSIKNK